MFGELGKLIGNVAGGVIGLGAGIVGGVANLVGEFGEEAVKAAIDAGCTTAKEIEDFIKGR